MIENSELRAHYNTVGCQILSPDGRYLVAGNIYGDISIFDIPIILGPQLSEEALNLGPKYTFKANPDSQTVQSLIKTQNFLVTGSCGEISGWDWKEATSPKCNKIKPKWSIQIPYKRDNLEKPDVNCMAYSETDHLMYVGCGDNKIHVIDLENGQVLQTLEGHQNYIHDLAISNKQIASGSEDGSVRLWDIRKRENTNILQPHLHEKVKRPKIGKWIGALDFTEDWLLCGGGPKLSLWHMRTMEATTVFNLPDEGLHVAEIYEERIIAGGSMPHLFHLNYQGTPLAKIPVSSGTVYSVAFQESPHKILSISGSSNIIDVCTNFNYKELELKFM